MATCKQCMYKKNKNHEQFNNYLSVALDSTYYFHFYFSVCLISVLSCQNFRKKVAACNKNLPGESARRYIQFKINALTFPPLNPNMLKQYDKMTKTKPCPEIKI